MTEVRTFEGGMDYDSTLYDVKKGSYLTALNITKDAVSGNNDLVVTNIVGNRKIDFSYPTGRSKVISSFGFELRGTVIFFRWNANKNHGIYEANLTTRVITKIFESQIDSNGIDILGFSEDGKITSVNVYPRDEGDLLFFLDSLGRPTEMDLTLFKSGVYIPVTRDLIDKGKMPPLSPPSVVYDNDTTRRANNLRNRLTRFKYRWIYDDLEKSTFSPISAVPLPVNILDDTFTNVVTNNNVIRMALNSGGKNVKAIEIGMSYVEKSNDWSDFQSVTVINKEENSIDDDVDFPYSFYNDSTYPDIDINESIQLFDYVPDYANAQEMPNGNVLAYIGITEGYNKDTVEDSLITVLTVPAGNGGSIGNLDAVVNITGDTSFQAFTIDFGGIPATGTLVEVRVQQVSGSAIFLAATYTTVSGDTNTSVASAINDSFDALGEVWTSRVRGANVAVQTNPPLQPKRIFYSITITPPASSADDNSIPTWKWSTERNIGRIYFNKKGKTNGVLYTDKVTFPAYAENGSHQPLIPYINYKINDIPPSWAYSFQFAFTKENTQYLFWETNAVQSDTSYFYWNVTGLKTNAIKKPTTEKVLSYTFQDGDRLRIIKEVSSGDVFADTFDAGIDGLVTDPVINSVSAVGQFLKIKNVAPFTAGIDTAENYVIEIYRPAQQSANKENQVYYEFGRQYAILNPTLSARVHSGEVTDQVAGVTPAEFNFYEGDAYFRGRTIAYTESGYATFNVMDRNFVDFYISAVSSIDGRPNIIDINAKRQYYSTLIRFGQAYQADTNVNGLNRFYPNNFDEYPIVNGDAVRLKVRGQYLKVFQKFKIGIVPLFGQITKDANGNETLVVTDKLLNPIQYRIGNFGLSAPESLASWHYADYGCDTNKGVIWRDSNDGVVAISELYKMSSWAADELPLRTGSSKIYGAINPKSNQYIAALEAYEVPIPYFSMRAVALSSVTGSFFTITSSAGYSINWGDGTTDTFAAGTTHPTHTYSTPYTGDIKIFVEDFSTITVLTSASTGISPISGGLIIETSELNKLTGLTTLILDTTVFLDGTAYDLPAGLVTLSSSDTNLTGNVSQLARTITSLTVTGSNALTGTVTDLPPNLTFLILYGNNSLSGDVADLPATLNNVIEVLGNNILEGDIADLPAAGIVDIEGVNTITGDIADLPSSFSQVRFEGYNTISGDITNINGVVSRFIVFGFNTLAGDIANLKPALTIFELTGHNSVFGDLAHVPLAIVYFRVISLESHIETYTSGFRTWAPTMNTVSLETNAGGLSTAEVDNLLIELAAQATTWVQHKEVNITGVSQARSAASDAAVTTLQSRSVTVTTNP